MRPTVLLYLLTFALAALFVAPESATGDAALCDLGLARAPDGAVVVDESGRTSVPGVYAAGNVTDPAATVIAAAAAGAGVAVAICADLVEERVASAAKS